MLTSPRLRFFLLLICGFVTLSNFTIGQTRREIIREVPDDFTASQWKVFRRAWSLQSPWLYVEPKVGAPFAGQLLFDEKGEGFHFWTTTEFFNPRLWSQHYRFIRYEEVNKINDLFVYVSRDAASTIAIGALSGALLGAPFGALPEVAIGGAVLGGGAFLTRQFMEFRSSPDLMFLMRPSGRSYYKDYRLARRQLFGNGLPDTTQLPYSKLNEWVEESTMMGKVFYQPNFQGYLGAGIAFLNNKEVTAAPFVETVVGIQGNPFSISLGLGAEVATLTANTNPDPGEPLLQYLDGAAFASYSIIEFNKFGKGLLRVSPEAGVLYRRLTYQFVTSGPEINQANDMIGAMLGVRADYRIGHKLAVWGRAQGKILPSLELPWPTPEFDPNILIATDINTSSFVLNAGFSWYF